MLGTPVNGQSAGKAVLKNLLIYRITNITNGKVYIGQTTQGLRQRKMEHICRFNLGKRDHKIYLAMRKYGIENFKFEALCNVFDREQLNDLEKFFIKKYNSFNKGYNMTVGGDAISEATIEKIRKAMLGRKITWYDKIIKSRKLNPNKKDPKEFVPKGEDNVNSKTYVITFPDGSSKRITGLRAFCEIHGLKHYAMFHILSGRQKSHGGFSISATFNDYPEREYTSSEVEVRDNLFFYFQ